MFYDFHVHSCLSPCADDDMTPFDIAGMARICGLDAIALTDHNSCLNLPAFFHACEYYEIIPIAGMELATSEEIHLICLFLDLASALEFSDFVESRLMKIKNKPNVFGHQYIYSPDETEKNECTLLLSAASSISLTEAFEKVTSYGGICYPAHIDRPSFSLTSVLGSFPDKPQFSYFELSNPENQNSIAIKHNSILKMKRLFGSDSHTLSNIGENMGFFNLADDFNEVYNSNILIKHLHKFS